MTWICFLPWRTTLQTAQRYHLLPTTGNLIVYEIPDDLLGETPQQTISAFQSVIRDVTHLLESDQLKGIDLAFLGISAGTIPAIYLANRHTCKKLVAVCPTIRLGEGIFSAPAAKKIKKAAIQKGFSAESYDAAIQEINSEHNLQNLPDNIEIYLARFDQFVPYSGGNKLATMIQQSKPNTKVHRFHFFGHILTLFVYGLRNRR